jgi:RNA polymerase-binding transcription factor DksA
MADVADVEQGWLPRRRAALVERLAGSDRALAVSSGCAASGAARHADEVESRAAVALARLDAGLADCCEDCGARIPRERLDAVLTATRCLPCAGPGTVDTRWCR